MNAFFDKRILNADGWYWMLFFLTNFNILNAFFTKEYWMLMVLYKKMLMVDNLGMCHYMGIIFNLISISIYLYTYIVSVKKRNTFSQNKCRNWSLTIFTRDKLVSNNFSGCISLSVHQVFNTSSNVSYVTRYMSTCQVSWHVMFYLSPNWPELTDSEI